MHIDYPFSPKARRCGSGWIDLCPAHDDHSPSLSINLGADGKLLLHCFTGCKFEDIFAAAGLSNISSARRMKPADLAVLEAKRLAEQHRKRDAAKNIWDSCFPLSGTLSETYLASRGVFPDSPTLRHHHALWHGEKNANCPTLVAAVHKGGIFTGIQRTFLTEEGRKFDRKMLGPCKGGAVTLSPFRKKLIVAEGIETAASMMTLYASSQSGCWAALSSSGMASLVLPRTPGELIVAADGDDAGRKAAEELAQRANLAGWSAHVVKAPNGKDFNDVLQEMRHGTI